MDAKSGKKRPNANHVKQPITKRFKKDNLFDGIADCPLHADMLKIVFENASPYERFVLSKTTSFWNRLWKDVCDKQDGSNFHEYCVKHNYENLLNWSMCLDLKKYPSTAVVAVILGNYDIVFRLKELGFPINSNVYNPLIDCRRDSNIMKRLYEILRVSPDPRMIYWAYIYKYPDIIEWMLENKFQISPKIISSAIRGKDLETLKRLHQWGYTPNRDEVRCAARCNITADLLEWFWDDLKCDLLHPYYTLLYRNEKGKMKLRSKITDNLAKHFLRSKLKQRSLDFFDTYYPKNK